MALQFNNGTNNKIVGKMYLDNLVYEYIIYLMPIQNTIYEAEVVSFFGNRYQNGQKCLNLNEEDILHYIDNNEPQVSAFIIVNQQGSDETASGTIQIYNWCNRSRGKKNILRDAQIWINDVCKILGRISGTSTIKAFFTLIEQFAIQKLGKLEVNLMVDKHNSSKDKLIEVYRDKYGFNISNCIEPKLKDSIEANYVTMKKENIVANRSIVDLTSVIISGGKKRKSKKLIKKKNLKKVVNTKTNKLYLSINI